MNVVNVERIGKTSVVLFNNCREFIIVSVLVIRCDALLGQLVSEKSNHSISTAILVTIVDVILVVMISQSVIFRNFQIIPNLF